MDIIVAEGGISVVVPLLSIFQPTEPTNLREFVVSRSVLLCVTLLSITVLSVHEHRHHLDLRLREMFL